MASPLCVNTVYKEWVNCKDARDLDILVFVFFCVFCFWRVFFGVFWVLVYFSMFLVFGFLVWGFLGFLSFWGGFALGFFVLVFV